MMCALIALRKSRRRAAPLRRLALGFGRDWVARNYHYRKPSERRFPARPRLSPPTPAGTLSATTAESPGIDFTRSQCSQRRMSSHKRITCRSAGKRSNGSPSRVGAASLLTDGGSGNADRTSSSVRSQMRPPSLWPAGHTMTAVGEDQTDYILRIHPRVALHVDAGD